MKGDSIVATRVDKKTRKAMSRILKANNLTVSTYLRQLIERNLAKSKSSEGESHE